MQIESVFIFLQIENNNGQTQISRCIVNAHISHVYSLTRIDVCASNVQCIQFYRISALNNVSHVMAN